MTPTPSHKGNNVDEKIAINPQSCRYKPSQLLFRMLLYDCNKVMQYSFYANLLVRLVPRLSELGGGGGGGEPGLYCEQKCLRNNPRGQDMTL